MYLQLKTLNANYQHSLKKLISNYGSLGGSLVFLDRELTAARFRRDLDPLDP